MLIELMIVLLLIAANGVLAGAEIAVVSVRKTRIQALAEQGRRGARALADLRKDPERFLATVQIGITVVGTAASVFGGSSVAADLEPLLRGIPRIGAYSHDIALGLVVAAISYLSLVLGELVPKSLALRAAEPYALAIARVLALLSILARPLVWLLTASSNLILRPFADRTTFTEARVSKDEIEQIVTEAAETGALQEHTRELASRALQFEGLTAADVMVPRNRIVALPRDAPPELIRRTLVEGQRSRVPVYDGTLDNVVGYVSAKELLPLALDGKLTLEGVVRPVKLFIETTPALHVLEVMQRERQRLSIIVDEHGAVAGLITIEDLVEELAGEFFSEHELGGDPIRREESGALVVRGDVAIRDVNRELPSPIEEPEGVTTMAGLAGVLAGGVIPAQGARLAANGGAVVEVLDASPRVVRRVRVIPTSEEAPEPSRS
jgi:putative hemolysin